MNYVVFMVLFFVAVLVLGLMIFFYWRSQYGVWAQERSRKKQASDDEARTIKYD